MYNLLRKKEKKKKIKAAVFYAEIDTVFARILHQ
jgi:hypothetical protein